MYTRTVSGPQYEVENSLHKQDKVVFKHFKR